MYQGFWVKSLLLVTLNPDTLTLKSNICAKFKSVKTCRFIIYFQVFVSMRKQAHTLQNTNFGQEKIADVISDFVVGVTRIELAAS